MRGSGEGFDELSPFDLMLAQRPLGKVEGFKSLWDDVPRHIAQGFWSEGTRHQCFPRPEFRILTSPPLGDCLLARYTRRVIELTLQSYESMPVGTWKHSLYEARDEVVVMILMPWSFEVNTSTVALLPFGPNGPLWNAATVSVVWDDVSC